MDVRTIQHHVRTKAGTFWIMPQPGVPGRVWLGVGSVPLGSYASAMQAADDVAVHATGHEQWDSSDYEIDDPPDLSEWNPGPPDYC